MYAVIKQDHENKRLTKTMTPGYVRLHGLAPVSLTSGSQFFHNGDQVMVSNEADPVRFLFISGKPIGELVAWFGPIVMSTNEELRIAFEEYKNGTFVGQKP